MRFGMAAALLGVTSLALAACGADVPTPTSAPAPAATATATPTTAPEPTATPTTAPAAAAGTPTPSTGTSPTPAAGPTATPAPIALVPTATPVPIALAPTATPVPTVPLPTATPSPLLPTSGPTTLTLVATADATIWQGAGAIASGGGAHLYVGTNNGGQPRRGLVRFDLTGIPAGSIVTSVSLSATINKVPPVAASPSFALHRLTASWGEGSSDSGGRGGKGVSATTNDATWTKRFTGGDSWASQGGDFVASASASSAAADWASSADLIADVQAWVNDGSANHGWIILETTEADKSVRRISSRESSNGPELTITFTAS